MCETDFTKRPKAWSRVFVSSRREISAWLWMTALIAGLLLTACGGSKNTDVSKTPQGEVDIDNLLNAPADQEKQNDEDAEVLRLLGIEPTKTEAQKTEPAVTPAQTETPPVSAEMQKEIERLQRELSSKDQQVTDLRNTLLERDSRLQQLEQQASQSQLRTRPANAATGGADGYLQRYAEARNLYEQRRYSDAIALFQEILNENDKSSYADNCQYWIGECYYGLGKFEQAIAEFEKVFKFARSNKSDAATLKLGLCYVRLNDRQQARSWFEQLLARYPNSPYVAYARNYLTKL
ncbi:MAG: tol-pal system protein YbgF [bacterium]